MHLCHRVTISRYALRWSRLAFLAAAIGLGCTNSGIVPLAPSCILSALTILDGAGQPLPASPQLVVRGTLDLTAQFQQSGPCSGNVLTWSTSSPTSVSVVKTGTNTATLTALAPSAAARVRVDINALNTTTDFVVVAGPLDHIAITPANPSVVVGQTRKLFVDLLDQDGFPTTGVQSSVQWSVTANPALTVDATGLVTATAVGSATVTATYTAVIPNLRATTVVNVTGVPIGSVTVTPPAASVAVGAAATPFTATIRDLNGVVLVGNGVTWQSLNPAIATVGAGSGTVTGVTAGTVTIRAISDGNVSIFGDAQLTVTVPVAPVLLAYAVADQPSAASYTADPAQQFNGTGGPITVTRLITGQYIVTIPGFGGAAGESRIPFVNAVTAGSTTCLAVSWNMIGVTDATVRVDCSTTAGALTDSKFTIAVFGQGALPSRFAFGNSGPTGSFPPVGGTATLAAASAWSSAGPVPTLSRLFLEPAGRYLMDLKVPASGITDIIPVLQPSGFTASRCAIDNWGSVDLVRVICFPIGSSNGIAAEGSFSAMFLEHGRPGKRWGASGGINAAIVTRNSLNVPNGNSQTGVGAYRVTFTGLARPAGGKETVLVTPWALDGGSCNPVDWSSVGSDLVVNVFCFDGAGAPRNGFFVVVMIE